MKKLLKVLLVIRLTSPFKFAVNNINFDLVCDKILAYPLKLKGRFVILFQNIVRGIEIGNEKNSFSDRITRSHIKITWKV